MLKLNTLLILSFLGLGALNAQITETVAPGAWTAVINWNNGVPTAGGTATVNHEMFLNIDLGPLSGSDYTFNENVIDPAGGLAHNIDQSNNSDMDYNANVFIEGNYTLNNTSQFIIRSGDTLRVGGNFTSGQNTFVEIEPTGVLYVVGDMEMNNNTAYLINGNVYVEGNLTSRNSASMAGTGNLEVEGDVDIRNASSLFGNTTDCTPGPCEYGSGTGLPIELKSFKAKSTNNHSLKIDWVTASEVNNEFFKVEISENGESFKTLAEVRGAGMSYEEKAYSIVRPNPFPNVKTVYLKLSQYDYDGKTESFNPIAVDLNGTSLGGSTEELVVYPNPSDGTQLNLRVEDLEAGDYELFIMGMDGTVYRNINVIVPDYHYEYEMLNVLKGVSALEKGIYYVRFKNNKINLNSKYIVN